MRWKAHLFLQEYHESYISKEDFGFKSKNIPPQYKQKEAFERKFLDMIPYIKFPPEKDPFQKKLKEDISKIKESPNVFVFQSYLRIALTTNKNFIMTTSQKHIK